ncbi:MAG: nucleotidyltransferase domain-containing protein [Armatimonadetes bacterium]|nr:nucleotidyltransferase domain-containing protein [Armatimonadota bacterium]
MAKSADKEIIYDIIRKYLKVLKTNKINLKKVYLYGSYIKGNFNKDSDIDLAIVADNFTGDIIEDQLLLMKLRRKVNTKIEPHPFLEKHFKLDNPYAKEIIENGKLII